MESNKTAMGRSKDLLHGRFVEIRLKSVYDVKPHHMKEFDVKPHRITHQNPFFKKNK